MIGTCPRCHRALDTSGPTAMCHGCRGLWVREASVGEMIAEMRGEAGTVEVPLVAAEGERLPCPICGKEMASGTLEDISVDRCADGHGYWFDADELGEVLRRSRPERSEEPSFLDRLLGRLK
jgi:Zn-finger nucleic acid-binding protein